MGTPAAYAPGTDGPYFTTIPDYLSDLNAMYEAENVLDSQQINRYGEFLMCAYTGFHGVWTITAYRRSVHATAAHRAKAFLQALGLYESND